MAAEDAAGCGLWRLVSPSSWRRLHRHWLDSVFPRPANIRYAVVDMRARVTRSCGCTRYDCGATHHLDCTCRCDAVVVAIGVEDLASED